ncbi:hypothetical protein GA0115244_10361 [Streptomyces sp. DvalAA-19]|nr:hypothetical protein GA0115244_10361 [Streptomyces sp. DvalAA-19]
MRPGGGSSPEPTGEAAPGPDSRAKGEDAPDPDPSPASPPDAPRQSVSLEHPGRSLHLGRGEAEVPESVDRPHFPSAGGAKRTEGVGHFQPVRRPRTEPSAEWTPLPAYGEEAGPRPTPPRRADGPGQGRDRDRGRDGDQGRDQGRGPGHGQGPRRQGRPAPPPPPRPPSPYRPPTPAPPPTPLGHRRGVHRRHPRTPALP